MDIWSLRLPTLWGGEVLLVAKALLKASKENHLLAASDLSFLHRLPAGSNEAEAFNVIFVAALDTGA